MHGREFGFPEHLGREPAYWFSGWLFFALVVVGLITLGYVAYRRRGSLADDPLRRVAARYATGKIERVEFERIQRDLDAVAEVPVAPVATPPESDTPGERQGEPT